MHSVPISADKSLVYDQAKLRSTKSTLTFPAGYVLAEWHEKSIYGAIEQSFGLQFVLSQCKLAVVGDASRSRIIYVYAVMPEWKDVFAGFSAG